MSYLTDAEYEQARQLFQGPLKDKNGTMFIMRKYPNRIAVSMENLLDHADDRYQKAVHAMEAMDRICRDVTNLGDRAKMFFAPDFIRIVEEYRRVASATEQHSNSPGT